MTHAATVETALLLAGALVALAVLATRVSARLGMPALILFVATGMLAGSEGFGGLAFDDPSATWAFGTVALAILLFAGGLDTDFREIRPLLGPGLALATVGVATSTGATAAFYCLLFGRPIAEGVLLGAIVSSTDAAAVFGVLRNAGVRLRKPIQGLVELESGMNDPVAIFLTLTATSALAGAPVSWSGVATGLAVQMGVGLLAGVAGGRGISWALERLGVPQEGLYPVFALSLALALFGGVALSHGSGFLAIYVAGIAVAARPLAHQRAVARFHDALAWLAQIAMFLVLGMLVFPSHVALVATRGVSIASFLVFVARPLAVFASLSPFRIPLRDQAMVAWVGLRGAVPIVLATWPRVMRVEGSEAVFDLVFFVVVLSVLAQGATLPAVARLLGVSEPAPAR
jgi:cell volume regulation protein A